MTIDMNSDLYKSYSIKSLVALGLTNYYTSHVLCIQKKNLFQDALRRGLIS